MKLLYILMLSTIAYNACGQTKPDKQTLRKNYAEKQLQLALTDKNQHNVIGNNTIIIKDSLTAINIIEPILFSVYGKDKIAFQRPYETTFINNYWVVSGVLPKGTLGGTFLIIIDAKDCRVIRITHGK